jgi:FdhD protein
VSRELDPALPIDSVRWEGLEASREPDTLVNEEPLEIRLDGSTVAVTMRTPGHDFELALGFLFTEGILQRLDQIASVSRGLDGSDHHPENLVEVRRVGAHANPPPPARPLLIGSSCGICGKTSLEAIARRLGPLDDPSRFEVRRLYELPGRLKPAQAVFASTGAVHGAAVFSAEGEPVAVREDIGRHNAVDKVAGWALREGRLPLRGHLLLVSGRISFEIVQKAWSIGVPAVAAVSGASTLAVRTARAAGMLLAGFLRGESMRIYAGEGRLERR